MKDLSFTLEPGASAAPPPFSYSQTVTRSGRWWWALRAACGRRIGEAKTRAGARAAIRTLYDQRQDAEAAAAMRSAA